MSSHKRPWFKWWVKDFNQDEKVKGLDWDAELIYRRLLDVMWQSNTCQLPNDIDYLSNAVAFAKGKEAFAKCWLQIQRPKFELFTIDGDWIYSKRLKKEMGKATNLSKQRKKYGKKGGKAKAKAKAKANDKQNGSDTDTDIDTELKEKDNNEEPEKTPAPKVNKFGDWIDNNQGMKIYLTKFEKEGWPKIRTAIGQALKQNKHPIAIKDLLLYIYKHRKRIKPDLNTYFWGALNKVSGNYYEQENISKHKETKSQEIPSIGSIFERMTEDLKNEK